MCGKSLRPLEFSTNEVGDPVEYEQFYFFFRYAKVIELRRRRIGPRPTSLGLVVPKENMYYVYLLHSQKTRKIYKGFTEDLKKRLAQHNKRHVSSTRAGVPWKLVYYEAFLNKTDALKEELFLKSGKGKERIKYLLEKTVSEIGQS